MKNNLLFLFIILTGRLLGQQNTCEAANPFCSSQSYTFPNATNSQAPLGPNYGCLGSQPNPIWYYMEIGTAGPVQILVEQTGESPFPFFPPGPTDVDFALWGPFSSISSGCAQIMSGSAPPIQCSFSPATTETIGIGVQGGTGSGQSTPPEAQVGEVYIVMLTNFDGTIGEITFHQTGGTGTTDCSIVEPDVCSIDDFTSTVSPCHSVTSTYSVTGTIAVTHPPATGQLIVESCDGTQVVVASAPFTAGSYPYNLTELNPDGAPCSVEAYFSDVLGGCSQILNYTAPSCQTPTSCSFTSVDVNLGACQPGNTFDLTGTVEFINPPSAGQLIVQDCSGNSVSFNPPFVSPLNFSITGIDTDGQPCNTSAHFTADPACSIDVSYINVQPCHCVVDIGTFTTSVTGVSNSTSVLCYGDEISIQANGDYIPAEEALNPPLPAGYEPGIGWVIYSCPPSVALAPHLTDEIEDDPCYIGIAFATDLDDVNDLHWIISYPGVFTDNIVYFVPLTMYNMTTDHYSYVNGGLPCYELGTPYPIQYLPEITGAVTADCQEGTLTVTLQGGSPALNGTTFMASNLTPVTASFVNNTTGNGGTIVVEGLNDGDNYSLQITDEFGCPIFITGIFQGESTAAISYPQNRYCKEDLNPTPSITGDTGGTFSGTSGLVIDPVTGVIDLVLTQEGSYTVTYTSQGGTLCGSSSTFDIEINAIPAVVALGDTVCSGETAILIASGAESYSWSPEAGLNTTSGYMVEAVLTESQIYTVTGIDNVTGCSATVQVPVIVDVKPDAQFAPNPPVGTQLNNQISFLNNSSGATGYLWDFGDSTGISTDVNPVYSYGEEPYIYTVTLVAVSQNGCADTAYAIVIIREDLIFYIPNTFTPDQDEYNQIFKPVFTDGYDPFDYTLHIYNRWGELIFESHNVSIGWDGTYGTGGTMCPDGMYTWKIEVKTKHTDERKIFVGHINLMR